MKLNSKTKLGLGIGISVFVLLILIASLWRHHCINNKRFNNRLLFKTFYFSGDESSAALHELEDGKTARFLSAGQQDLLHLKKASNLVKDGDLHGALSELKLILENSKIAELQTLALVRSVRLFIELNMPTKGAELLKQYREWLPTLSALELQGDLYYVEGKFKEARASYLKAWQCNPDEETYRRLLLKMLSC